MLRLNALSRALPAIALAMVATLAAGAHAQEWVLDPEHSHVAFISTKNGNVAEVHHFSGLSGAIDAEGVATVEIALDSVETAIPIRNERLREMLFETAKFPQAVISTRVSADVLASASATGSVAKQRVTVALHGAETGYDAELVLSEAAGGALSVSTREPLVIDAATFDLGGGVEALREIAGLNMISTAVPVTAHLVFVPAE
jgi:hypothetical protein